LRSDRRHEERAHDERDRKERASHHVSATRYRSTEREREREARTRTREIEEREEGEARGRRRADVVPQHTRPFCTSHCCSGCAERRSPVGDWSEFEHFDWSGRNKGEDAPTLRSSALRKLAVPFPPSSSLDKHPPTHTNKRRRRRMRISRRSRADEHRHEIGTTNHHHFLTCSQRLTATPSLSSLGVSLLSLIKRLTCRRDDDYSRIDAI